MNAWQTVQRQDGRPLDREHLRELLMSLGETPPRRRRRSRPVRDPQPIGDDSLQAAA